MGFLAFTNRLWCDALEKSFARLDCIKLTYVEVSDSDIDGDGIVNLRDAVLLLKSILNENAKIGDMNADGKISLLDVLHLLKKIVE